MDIYGIRTVKEAEKTLVRRSRTFSDRKVADSGSVLFFYRFDGEEHDVAIWFKGDEILTIF